MLRIAIASQTAAEYEDEILDTSIEALIIAHASITTTTHPGLRLARFFIRIKQQAASNKRQVTSRYLPRLHNTSAPEKERQDKIDQSINQSIISPAWLPLMESLR